MAVITTSIRLRTKGDTDLVDITAEVGESVRDSGISSGIVTVFIPGSTARVTTIEYESGQYRISGGYRQDGAQGHPLSPTRGGGTGTVIPT
jgi:hypothetical protein